MHLHDGCVEYSKCLPTVLTPLAERASFSQAAGRKPHIVMLLVDDFGWANAGWHRGADSPEVRTPTMDALVRSGVELDRHYVYQARKTPRRPRSWANFSLFVALLCSHYPTGMHGPTCTFWPR